jgi:hypothetical protein
MVRAENHRHAVDGGFVEVVYSGAESPAYICHVGIAVERREFAE